MRDFTFPFGRRELKSYTNVCRARTLATPGLSITQTLTLFYYVKGVVTGSAQGKNKIVFKLNESERAYFSDFFNVDRNAPEFFGTVNIEDFLGELLSYLILVLGKCLK